MKGGLFVLFLVAGLYAGCGGGTQTASRPPQADDDPFPVLSGYGNWLDVAGVGRVWQPPYQADWRPFTNGWWEWTDQGWMFDSDEPYGWVVYHYGGWTRLGATGWVWVPGYDWSPARVRWYSGNEFICWAPIPPSRAVVPRLYDAGFEDYWVVVPASRFPSNQVGQFRANASLPHAGIARPAFQERSPDVEQVQRASNRQIPMRRTDREDVRVGQRTLPRVRVRQESPTEALPVPLPAETPAPGRRQPAAPPSGAQPADRPTPRPTPPPQPALPPGKVRQPGTVRTPPGEKQKPVKAKEREEKKLPAPKRAPGAPRDSIRAR